ncbi:hypothetical protein [Microcoleus sp.]|uniref:hypothetical protein n=1 Tax=Microcoleus sp. TaxID=44472 RepID=UPI0035936768
MNSYLDFGTPISFGYTAQYLDYKTCTRREWKDNHAAKFCNAYDRAAAAGQQLRVPAIDKGYHAGGKQIGWCLINCRPCKQRLWDMDLSNADLMAEGGMCRSVADFIRQYFPLPKSAVNLGFEEDLREVWVIQFQFTALPDANLKFVPVEERPLYKMLQARRVEALREIEIIKQSPRSLWPEFMLKMFPEVSPPVESAELPWMPLNAIPAPNPSLKVFGSSKTDEHNTPEFITDAARAVMGGIDLDPMSNAITNRTIRAHQIYTKSDDGLPKPWCGRIWLNPPFSLADRAVEKLIAGYESGDVFEAILLIKSAPDTKRHQSLYPYPFCDLNGRLKFEAEGNKQSAPFATTLFYLGSNFPRFREIMSAHGRIHLGRRLTEELESDRLRLRNEIEILKNGTKLDLSTILKHCDKCGGRGCGECDFVHEPFQNTLCPDGEVSPQIIEVLEPEEKPVYKISIIADGKFSEERVSRLPPYLIDRKGNLLERLWHCIDWQHRSCDARYGEITSKHLSNIAEQYGQIIELATDDLVVDKVNIHGNPPPYVVHKGGVYKRMTWGVISLGSIVKYAQVISEYLSNIVVV